MPKVDYRKIPDLRGVELFQHYRQHGSEAIGLDGDSLARFLPSKPDSMDAYPKIGVVQTRSRWQDNFLVWPLKPFW